MKSANWWYYTERTAKEQEMGTTVFLKECNLNLPSTFLVWTVKSVCTNKSIIVSLNQIYIKFLKKEKKLIHTV